jgi:hypothetical protein
VLISNFKYKIQLIKLGIIWIKSSHYEIMEILMISYRKLKVKSNL